MLNKTTRVAIETALSNGHLRTEDFVLEHTESSDTRLYLRRDIR
jgi:hypothetical protein